MRISSDFVVRCAALGALIVVAVACTEAPVPVDPAYAAEIDEWREQRLARLTADDGWLTLTGLYWLEPGENTFGSAPGSAVVLPDSSVLAKGGTLDLTDDHKILASSVDGSGATINGEPLSTSVLKTDAEGRPDVITVGRAQFHVINRNGRFGARVKDPEAPSRLAFEGIDHFPISPVYKVKGTFEPYDEAREVPIPTVLGTDTTMLAFGLLRFSIDGRELTLEPYMGSADADSMFLIFRDGTSGDTTYGAGRFMSAPAPGENGTTELDFNLAYNPPCAFTPYATCPLPPPQNVLDFTIEAGEKYHGETH